MQDKKKVKHPEKGVLRIVHKEEAALCSDRISPFLLGRARHLTGADLKIFFLLKENLGQASGDRQATGSQRSPTQRATV